MIIDFIVTTLMAFLNLVFGLIPSYALPDGVTSAGGTLGAPLAALNGVFPIATLGECVLVVLGARGFMLVWRVVVFVYDRIPFKAT